MDKGRCVISTLTYVLSVHLHNMWVTTELLCRCRLRTYKATEEIRKDASATTKKRLWNESRSKRVKRYRYQSRVVMLKAKLLGGLYILTC
jgi:hypothetical protein